MTRLNKEWLWTISNLLSDNGEFSNYFTRHEIFTAIIEIIQQRHLDDVAREALWCICNSINICDDDAKVELIKNKFMTQFTDILKQSKNNAKMLKLVLLSLDKMLSTSSKFSSNDEDNPIYCFEMQEGVETLEDFLNLPNVQIFTLSQQILRKYFPNGEDVENVVEIEEQNDSEDANIEF